MLITNARETNEPYFTPITEIIKGKKIKKGKKINMEKRERTFKNLPIYFA